MSVPIQRQTHWSESKKEQKVFGIFPFLLPVLSLLSSGLAVAENGIFGSSAVNKVNVGSIFKPFGVEAFSWDFQTCLSRVCFKPLYQSAGHHRVLDPVKDKGRAVFCHLSGTAALQRVHPYRSGCNLRLLFHPGAPPAVRLVDRFLDQLSDGEDTESRATKHA